MYSEEGRCEDSSSCRYVARERGGTGIEVGIGDGKAMSATEGSNLRLPAPKSKVVGLPFKSVVEVRPVLCTVLGLLGWVLADDGVDIDRTVGLGLSAVLMVFSGLWGDSAGSSGGSGALSCFCPSATSGLSTGHEAAGMLLFT